MSILSILACNLYFLNYRQNEKEINTTINSVHVIHRFLCVSAVPYLPGIILAFPKENFDDPKPLYYSPAALGPSPNPRSKCQPRVVGGGGHSFARQRTFSLIQFEKPSWSASKRHAVFMPAEWHS